MHWSDAYLGRMWVEGEYDCADLAIEIQREEFGKAIDIPRDHGCTAFGRNEVIRETKFAVATPTANPEDGDAVVLIAKGRAQHVGTFCVINDEPWVLHNQQGAGTHRTRIRDLPKWQYAIEGYYKWK